METSKPEILGVDIGGVIIDRINDGTDTAFFGDNFLRTTAVPDAFEAISRLARQRFGGRVHLVSKCGQKVQEKSMLWLAHHKFYEQTGVQPQNIHFCRKRHEKAPICQKLGVTHFVDDRLEVLGFLSPVVPNLYLLNADAAEMKEHGHHLHRVTSVTSWTQILARLV